MAKRVKKGENYLERIPAIKEALEWTADENGIVTVSIHNKGFFNFIAQKLFKKPKITYVHLEENGSFIWQIMDGKKRPHCFGQRGRRKIRREGASLV